MRTQRVASQTSPISIQSIPPGVSHALNILFISAILFLASTIPKFRPENIFALTSSRLQTPTDVLFTRLGLLRPGATLTESDRILRLRLASLDAKCLYFTYGPDVLTHCPFCISDKPNTYFFYALPSLLLPHVLHLFALGLATSSAVAGKYGSKWRTSAVAIGVVLALYECYSVSTHDSKANARVILPQDLDLFHWRMRTMRGIMIAITDAGLAFVLWAASTNRIFAEPPNPSERMDASLKVLENVRARLAALGVVKNVLARDEGLRKRGEEYWRREGQVMAQVMDEKEVVDGVRNALVTRINVAKVEEDAKKYAERLVDWNKG